MGNKNVLKIAIFGLTHWLKHRITRKLLKTDGYMLWGVWQALNCLSIHAIYCVIFAGASPGETKMWAAVREKGDFLHLQFEKLGNCWRKMGLHAARGLASTELSFHSCNILRILSPKSSCLWVFFSVAKWLTEIWATDHVIRRYKQQKSDICSFCW